MTERLSKYVLTYVRTYVRKSTTRLIAMANSVAHHRCQPRRAFANAYNVSSANVSTVRARDSLYFRLLPLAKKPLAKDSRNIRDSDFPLNDLAGEGACVVGRRTPASTSSCAIVPDD